MVKHLRLALMLLLGTAIPLFAVTVDGTATLQGETNHSGIRVLFTEASPSAVTDSAFTDGSGYFSIDLAIGVYDVEYSHDQFLPVDIEEVGLVSNETLGPVELWAEASSLTGELSGTISAGTYWVLDNISVPEGAELEIEAGATLLFTGTARFWVYGTLIATGTAQDSIYFTSAYPDSANNWEGVWFYACDEGSRAEYCVFEYSDFSGAKALGCSPDFLNCTFRYNYTTGTGGGIDCYDNVHPYIANCLFFENTAHEFGGMFLRSASDDTSYVVNCVFSNNHASSIGGGLGCYANAFIESGNIIVQDCIFSGNTAMTGSGVTISGDGAALIQCIISDNIAANDTMTLYGGGIHCQEGAPLISNCTITGNVPSGISMDESMARINSSIIAYNSGYGIVFHESNDAEVLFCNFWDNAWASVGNPDEAPVLLGQIVTVNQNDDSSDVYYNISQDPLFVNQMEGDFHLQELSHCIDAGDTTLSDPDGTICDIGAYYYPQAEQLEPGLPIPVSHALLSNYPNPFNPSTNISFIVDQAGSVKLAVYDITGRMVAELVNDNMPAGAYTTYWNATSSSGIALPSGSYWVQLNTPSQTAMHRIVLIR